MYTKPHWSVGKGQILNLGDTSLLFFHTWDWQFLFTDDILFKKNNTQLKIEFQYHSSGTQEIFRTYVCYCGKRKYDISSLDIFLSTHVNHPTSMTVGKNKGMFRNEGI